VIVLLILSVLIGVGGCQPQKYITPQWVDKVSKSVWVAYSPPNGNPDRGIQPTNDDIQKDLTALRRAGFSGLVTYGSSGILGREIVRLAQAAGFEGLILGVWDPFNQEELNNAISAANSPIVLGFCVGNEGLHERYEITDLALAIEKLHAATGKPVTTTEQIDDYGEEALLTLGDWIFPNAHPYFHSQTEPVLAVRWTATAFDNLSKKTDRFIIFKEVGLPSAGDSAGRLSETDQDLYYHGLVKTSVRFVYFEAFDQPWKTYLPVEPHWGIFQADRSPKLVARRLIEQGPIFVPAKP